MANKTTLTAPASAPCTCPPWDITSLDELCPVCLQEWRTWWLLCELDDVAANRAAAAAAAAGAPSGASALQCLRFSLGAWSLRAANGRWFDFCERRHLSPERRWLRSEAGESFRRRGRARDHFFPPA